MLVHMKNTAAEVLKTNDQDKHYTRIIIFEVYTTRINQEAVTRIVPKPCPSVAIKLDFFLRFMTETKLR